MKVWKKTWVAVLVVLVLIAAAVGIGQLRRPQQQVAGGKTDLDTTLDTAYLSKYLSDGADWDAGERYGDRRIFLVPPLQGTAWVDRVEAMTEDRLAWNTARYKLWSADGVWWARLTDEPTAFSVSWQKPGEGSDGSTYDLRDWDGLETAITGLAWREDGKLTIKCETADGGTSRLTFDPETETLT